MTLEEAERWQAWSRDAGRLRLRCLADSSVPLSRDSQSNKMMTGIIVIKGSFPDFIKTPSSLKISGQLTVFQYDQGTTIAS